MSIRCWPAFPRTSAAPVLPPHDPPGAVRCCRGCSDADLLSATSESNPIRVNRPAASRPLVLTPTAQLAADRSDGLRYAHGERTAAQDVAFGLRQLTDVAVKALSPASTIPPPRSTPSDTPAPCSPRCGPTKGVSLMC
ncbi:DUF2254 family protein [Nakamurella sp.]|uniref:DUF2254 family protein n=1 Tax=Nakamurella sp. TaxID=1869182 RepID=UPI003783A637